MAMKIVLRTFCCAALSAMLGNCASSRFAKPIGTFGTALSAAAPALKGYYEGLNTFERKVYVDERVLNPALETFTAVGGKPTALRGAFPQESLDARLRSLELLGAYAKKLAEVANSTAGKDFQSAAADAGTAIGDLAGSFSKLSGRGDSSAAKYIGPVSELVGLIGRSYIELKRDAALKRAILDGAPPVTTIINALVLDLGKYRRLLLQTGYEQMLADWIAHYNANRAKMDQDEREAALAQITLYAEAAEAAKKDDVGKFTDALKKGHTALVKSAGTNFASDFDAFVQGVGEILQRIEAMKAAADKLRAK